MKLIVCADNRNGLAFGGRRQSRDRLLREDILALTGAELWLRPYSAKLFPEMASIHVADDPLVPPEAYLFLEAVDPAPYFKDAEQLIVYRWNRDYPGDVFLSLDGWQLQSRKDFSGSSHECLTREEYIR